MNGCRPHESLRWHLFAEVPMSSEADRIAAREDERLKVQHAARRF